MQFYKFKISILLKFNNRLRKTNENERDVSHDTSWNITLNASLREDLRRDILRSRKFRQIIAGLRPSANPRSRTILSRCCIKMLGQREFFSGAIALSDWTFTI